MHGEIVKFKNKIYLFKLMWPTLHPIVEMKQLVVEEGEDSYTRIPHHNKQCFI